MTPERTRALLSVFATELADVADGIEGLSDLVQRMRVGVHYNKYGRKFGLQNGLADIFDVATVGKQDGRYFCQDAWLVLADDRQHEFIHGSSIPQERLGLWLGARACVKPYRRTALVNRDEMG